MASRTVLVAGVAGLLIANTASEQEIAPVYSVTPAEQASVEVVDGLTEQYVTDMVAELAAVVGTDTAEIENSAVAEVNYEAQTAHIVKSQVVQTDVVTAEDISKHTVAEGETLDSIAEEYGVSKDTLKWANNLTSDTVGVGDKLTVPPVDGVIHTVESGDTPEKLADKFKANAEEIIAFNDAELSGLTEGEKIIIPGGEKPAPVVPVRRYFAAVNNTAATSAPQYGSGYFGNYAVLARGTYAGMSVWSTSPNGFYGGQCTWWADVRASQLGNSMAGMRGNASAWDYRSGFTTTKTPRVGAVVQTKNYGAGHVGVVEAVSGDGSMIKYSDMNGLAGRGVAAITSDWVAVQGHWNFIYGN